MTRSFGSPGGRPDNSGGSPGRGPGKMPGRSSQALQSQNTVQPVRIELGKRLVALIIDFFACYLFGAAVAFIPFVNTFLPLQAVMVLVFLCRDFLFEGRGIGKNLMGLQVVDLRTGAPCSLIQSVKRNIVLFAPYVVWTLVSSVLRVVPVPWLSETVGNVINLAGMVYCALVIPVEGYRVYNREDGLRIGDDIAGTGLIEAPMDFSRPLPRQ